MLLTQPQTYPMPDPQNLNITIKFLSAFILHNQDLLSATHSNDGLHVAPAPPHFPEPQAHQLRRAHARTQFKFANAQDTNVRRRHALLAPRRQVAPTLRAARTPRMSLVASLLSSDANANLVCALIRHRAAADRRGATASHCSACAGCGPRPFQERPNESPAP